MIAFRVSSIVYKMSNLFTPFNVFLSTMIQQVDPCIHPFSVHTNLVTNRVKLGTGIASYDVHEISSFDYTAFAG